MSRREASRGVTPTVGIVLLLAVTVVTAGLLGVVLPTTLADPPPQAHLSLAATSDGTIALAHEGGEALDPSALRVQVEVGGDPLQYQPPVPFFAATGFVPGPTGAFNSASGGLWRAGETASLQVAGTNDPEVVAGVEVRVRVYAGDAPLASLSTVVEE